MKLKQSYKILSVLSMLLGGVIFFSTQNSTVGSVILKNNISTSGVAVWGAFFIVSGVILYYLQTLNR